MYIKAAPLLLAVGAIAAPISNLESRQTSGCPNVHVFGARETTAPAGMGSAGTVVKLIVQAHSGATSEAINYPAAGGSSYGSSVQAGNSAVASQGKAFASKCPQTEIVLVGYSQVSINITTIMEGHESLMQGQ